MKSKIRNWFIVYTLVYIFFTSITILAGSKTISEYPVKWFMMNFLFFQFVAFTCWYGMYHFSKRLLPAPFLQVFLLSIPLGLIIALVDIVILFSLDLSLRYFFNQMDGITWEIVYNSFLQSLILTSLITTIVSSATMRIEFLEKEKELYQEVIRNYKNTSKVNITTEKPTQEKLSIVEKDISYEIDFNDIIYVSSHGAKLVIHTEEKEISAYMRLKDIISQIPENLFVRIHKSFAINLQKLDYMEYNKGGSYFAYLNDSESTLLPVGRVYAKILKDRLNQK